MKQRIFVVNTPGELLKMQPSAPPDEASLQDLIARHPDIIGDSDGRVDPYECETTPPG